LSAFRRISVIGVLQQCSEVDAGTMKK
jgi:hypothetical protein